MSDMVPIGPKTVTVNGEVWKASDPWDGLDFSKAKMRLKSSLWVALVGQADAPFDIHLEVPWCHPIDQPAGWKDGCRYRVRPRKDGYSFKRVKGQWMVSPPDAPLS